MFAFKDFDFLTDGEMALRITKKTPANPAKNWVPAYFYDITLYDSNERMGGIDIRIGDNENLYYGGHIGYNVDEKFRGHAYAAKACLLIQEVAKGHGMKRLIITCNPDNMASRRTCEKVGLRLQEIVDLPETNDMYLEGERSKCIYVWDL